MWIILNNIQIIDISWLFVTIFYRILFISFHFYKYNLKIRFIISSIKYFDSLGFQLKKDQRKQNSEGGKWKRPSRTEISTNATHSTHNGYDPLLTDEIDYNTQHNV